MYQYHIAVWRKSQGVDTGIWRRPYGCLDFQRRRILQNDIYDRKKQRREQAEQMNKIQYDKKRLTEAGVVILALVTAAAVGTGSHGKQAAKEERSYEKGRQTAVVLENKKMASGEMTFADGTAVTVELRMKQGTFYNDTMEEYFPGIYTYTNNYEGSYAIVTLDADGETLCETALDKLWKGRDQTFNFPQEFSLKWTDYNKDGCPDFTIGQPQSSSNMGFLLLTVRENGSIALLCREEIASVYDAQKGFSAILEQGSQTGAKTIQTVFYNNATGENERADYVCDERENVYRLVPWKSEVLKEEAAAPISCENRGS